MPLLAAIDRPIASMVAYAPTTEGVRELPFRNYFQTDAMRSVLNDIRVAGVVYPLRQACATDYIPVIGEFLVEGFSPTFIGRGKTPKEAYQDWALSVHAAFQELQFKRPFEMTAEDQDAWSVLASRIDVTVYRNQTPLHVRQFGKIGRARPYPEQIIWDNGTADEVSLAQVESPDFITFKPGQPLEALVVRDPVTFQLLRIAHIQRRPSATRLLPGEEAELLASIGSTKILSTASWD